MANITKGILLTCDPAIKQFLIYLEETDALSRKFIIQDLDETHLFIENDSRTLERIQEKIDEMMKSNSFTAYQPTANMSHY